MRTREVAARPRRRIPNGVRWLAAAAVAGLAIGLTVQFGQDRPLPALRGGASAVAKLRAPDPPSLKQQLIRELEATGLHVKGYESFGREGIDADLPSPLPDSVRVILERYGIPEPVDHVLRVEIEPTATP